MIKINKLMDNYLNFSLSIFYLKMNKLIIKFDKSYANTNMN